MTGIFRGPAEETQDYPGLFVHDARVTGSITVSQSRLPYWALAGLDWHEVVTGWPHIESEYGWTFEKHADFLYCLMEMRGEFARLLCVLADAERRGQHHMDTPWWETKGQRRRVLRQLKRCVAALEGRS